jgi:hypothetical protein
MDAAFAEECVAIRELMARATRDEVAARHQIGLRLRRLKSLPDKYGEHAVDRVANELGVGTATLYRCATVAGNWTSAELHILMKRTNRAGEPLSWSHLLALTHAHSAQLRQRWAERCLDESWSVRELRQHITGAVAAQPGEEGQSVRAALTEGIQSASRAAIQLGIFVEALESRLADEGGDERLVSRAIATFENLRTQVEASLGKLRDASTGSHRRLRVATALRAIDDLEEDLASAPPSPTARKRAT